jgi:hypothetical protein
MVQTANLRQRLAASGDAVTSGSYAFDSDRIGASQ